MKHTLHLTEIIRRGFISLSVVLITGMFPVQAYAAQAPSGSGSASSQQSSTPTTSAPAPSNGVAQPTGVAAATYQYNPETGLWENDYYTWNPVTKQTLPKVAPEYTYNAATGMWDTSIWQYITSQGKYVLVPVSVAQPPAGAITHGGPPPAVVPAPSSQTNAADPAPVSDTAANGTANNSAAIGPAVAAAVTSPTGTNLSNNNASSQTLNFNTAGTITNLLNSTAQSGNAQLLANTTAGNATSGQATTVANIINLLQSSASFAGQSPAVFTANIQGNVSGDLLIDPATLAQPASLNQQNSSNLVINNKSSGTINNDINLGAVSGNASAINNTTAGNISTGNANAVANVVNLLNSIVAANQSFLGVVNIYGNYDGNILVPADSLNALLASTGPSAVTTGSNTTSTSAALNNNTSQTINNNVGLHAASGSANATANTTAGNVNTGSALTNLTLLNLTGHQIIGSNSLLVFVNVLGSWVGLIMNAPAGSTAAALGGGITQNNSNSTANLAMNNNTSQTINNNLNLSAQSGNALAARNTSVGNVTSGNATASANIVNLTGDQLDLSNWFGILFINVFGSWHGNFGALSSSPAVAAGNQQPAPATNGATATVLPAMFGFVPGGGSASHSAPYNSATINNGAGSSNAGGGMMLAASKVLADQISQPVLGQSAPVTNAGTAADKMSAGQSKLFVLPILVGLTGIGYVATDRFRNGRSMSRQR